MWHEHDMGLGGWIVMAVVLIIVVAPLVWLVLRTTGGDAREHNRSPERVSGGGEHEPPLRILERRLADGTITVEDYQQRQKILAGDHEQPPD
jgi:uncharacterized membrane protein